MEKLQKANTANTDRFPSFGLYPEEIDEELVDYICARVDAPREVVLQTLRTMVMVLPTHKIDQYIVHDVWGHTWQEALAEFEWEYALVPLLGAPLAPDTGPAFGGSKHRRCSPVLGRKKGGRCWMRNVSSTWRQPMSSVAFRLVSASR